MNQMICGVDPVSRPYYFSTRLLCLETIEDELAFIQECGGFDRYSPDQLERIFEPYVEGYRKISRALSKRIADAETGPEAEG